ncbi:MAG: hypothetical protein WCD79_16120 [Chthoniobacteraceae bacterium]
MSREHDFVGFFAVFRRKMALFWVKLALFWLCFLGFYRVKIGFVWQKSVFLGSLPSWQDFRRGNGASPVGDVRTRYLFHVFNIGKNAKRKQVYF